MKIRHLLLCTLTLLALVPRTDADILYGSTAAGGPGELYILDPATGGIVQDVGPLLDVSNVNFGITGLAFNPVTGVLYGSTGNAVAGTEAKLVTINPTTGLVTVIGSFNAGPANSNGTPATMADIAFDSAGNLFGIGSIAGPQLYSINIATGQVTLIGNSGLTSTSGGGLAISAVDVFYGTPTSSRFGIYNSSTGAYTNIADPTKPVGGAYAALAFDSSGILFGLDLGPDGTTPPKQTHLVIISTAGAVTDIGASVGLLDAIAFAPVPEPSTLVLLLGSGMIGLWSKARRRS